MKAGVTIAAVVIVMGFVPTISAQSGSLTLQEAVRVGLEKNPSRKAAAAQTRASSAAIREARSGLLPKITFSELAARGNDPVYVFGSKLRQQRFTIADFSLNKLNTPLPFGNFTTRFSGAWNLFDSFATLHGINQAEQMSEAAYHQLERTDQEIEFRVINAYYGVLLAAKQLEVAQQSVKTAAAILDRSQARFDSGLVVESDLLTAKVRMAARQQALVRSTNALDLARAELSTAMGVPNESLSQPSEVLAERILPIPVLAEAEAAALRHRPDLKGIQAEEAAQQQSVARAKSSFGPRLNVLAGWEMDNPTFVAGGGGNNWLGGLELQFDIFQGGAKRAELARERALQDKIVAMKQVATDGIRLEVRRAFYNLESARHEVEVTRSAIAQAQESLRINQDRYDSGLITISDLFSNEEDASRSQTSYWEALYRFHVAFASLELASGTLDTQSPVITP